MAPRRRWLVLVVPIWLAFAIRVAGLDDQSLWYDEGYTAMFSRRDLTQQLVETARLELNTPLHYAALHVWMTGAGTSEFSVRLLSVFAVVSTVALAYPLVGSPRRRPMARTAAHIRGAFSPWYAATLVAVWPLCVYLSREARMYALVVALCTLSVVLLLRCMQSGHRWLWWAWAASNVAAFAAHMLSIFVIAAQALVVGIWWLSRGRRAGVRPLIALCAIAFAIGAWAALLVGLGADYGTTFTDRLDYAVMLLKGCLSLFVARLPPDEAVMGPAAAAAFALLAGLAVSVPRGRLLFGIAFLSLAGITAMVCLTGKFAPRYPAIVAPLVAAGYATAVGRGMALRHAPREVESRLRGVLKSAVRVASVALAVGAVTACAAGLIAQRGDPAYAREDFRGAAAFLRAKARSDEIVLLVSGHFAPVFAYYYGSQGWMPLPDDPVLDIRNLLSYDRVAPQFNQTLTGKRGVWLLLWQDLVTDPTGIVQTLLIHQAGGADFDTRDFRGLRLLHYTFPQYAAVPERLPQVTSEVEDAGPQRGLSATGCQTFGQAYAGKGSIEIVCQWLLRPPPPQNILPFDVKVILRLVDEGGNECARGEYLLAPINGMPARWDERPITSLYVMPVPDDLNPGRYVLQASPSIGGASVAPIVTAPVEIAAQ